MKKLLAAGAIASGAVFALSAQAAPLATASDAQSQVTTSVESVAHCRFWSGGWGCGYGHSRYWSHRRWGSGGWGHGPHRRYGSWGW